jgi:hypothetical protein
MKTSEQLRIRKPSVHSLLRRTGFYRLTYFIGVQRSNYAFRYLMPLLRAGPPLLPPPVPDFTASKRLTAVPALAGR